MAFNVIDLCEISPLKNLNYLTKCKLDKPIRWVHVVELSEDIESLERDIKSGDLLISMGPFMKDDFSILMQLIDIASDYDLAGIVLYNNIFSNELPDSIVNFANRKNITLAQITGNNPSITTLTSILTENITAYRHSSPDFIPFHLLLDLIKGDLYDDELLFMARAQSLGFDLSIPHQAIWISAIPKPGINDSINKIANREWMNCGNYVLSHYYDKAYLKANRETDSMFLVPETYVPIERIVEQIMDACNKKNINHEYDIRIGIGSLYSNVYEFPKTLQEARQVTAIMKTLGVTNEFRHVNTLLMPIFVYNEVDNPMLKKICENDIVPLLEIDAAGNSDLIHTITVFLECGGNISKAAEQLFLHRNTLRTRIEKIEEVTNKDLKIPWQYTEMQLALYYYQVNGVPR